MTVLNGHIHQVIEHADGNIRFATAASTAYPQPAPGTADKPGPLTLPKDQLLHAIGFRTVELDGGRAASPSMRWASRGNRSGARRIRSVVRRHLEAAFAARVPDALGRAYEAHARALYAVARHVLPMPRPRRTACTTPCCVPGSAEILWPELGPLRTFLIACVRNEALSALRASGRRSAREERAVRLQPVREATFDVVDHVEAQRVREALAALPADQRGPLELVYSQPLARAGRAGARRTARHAEGPARGRDPQAAGAARGAGGSAVNDRHLGDDAELYALGALDGDEIAAAERHLAACDACAAQVARARDVVAALAAPLRAYPPPAIGFPPPAAVAPARAARPRWDRRLAALAAVAVLGLGIAGWQDVVLTRQRADADLALAAIVHGHFGHAGFTPGAPGAPAAKVLYARDGAWLYLVVDRPESGLRLRPRRRAPRPGCSASPARAERWRRCTSSGRAGSAGLCSRTPAARCGDGDALR